MSFMHVATIVAIALGVAVAGCSAPTDPDTDTAAPASPGESPGTETTSPIMHDVTPADVVPTSGIDTKAVSGVFEGTLPCASCPGIDAVLDLRPDGSFALAEQYRGDTRTGFELEGNWTVEGSLVRLDPNAKDEQDRLFQLLPPNELHLLDGEGQPVESSLDHGLTRTPAP